MGIVTLLTVREVATFYRVTPRTVETWIAKGAITAVRTPSGQPRVPSSACVAVETKNPEE
jgi:excisionase family DNA binding protein